MPIPQEEKWQSMQFPKRSQLRSSTATSIPISKKVDLLIPPTPSPGAHEKTKGKPQNPNQLPLNDFSINSPINAPKPIVPTPSSLKNNKFALLYKTINPTNLTNELPKFNKLKINNNSSVNSHPFLSLGPKAQ